MNSYRRIFTTLIRSTGTREIRFTTHSQRVGVNRALSCSQVRHPQSLEFGVKSMKEKKKSHLLLVRTAWVLMLASACWLAAPDRLREHFAPTATAAPVTFIVNTTDDTDDSACNVAHCSLREAIKAANANSGLDTINFNIPG